MNEVNPASLVPMVAWGGFVLAFVFGFVGNRTNFCTMGAVSDVVNMGDWNRMRMWLLAIAVAIVGANALELAGVLKLSNSIYTTPNFTWLSYVVGGLLFGIGMTLGSGCGSKTLIRVGGGNLKSLVVLVFMAIAAYMTLRGLFGSFRVGVLEPVNTQLAGGQDLPTLFAKWFGGERRTMVIVATVIVAGALLVFTLAKREFRQLRLPARRHRRGPGDRGRMVRERQARLRPGASRHPAGGVGRDQHAAGWSRSRSSRRRRSGSSSSCSGPTSRRS